MGGERGRERREYKAFGGEVAEAEIAEDDLGGVEEVEGAAVVAAEEESLRLHVDVSWIGSEGSHFIRKKYGRGVEMLAQAIPHHSSQLFYLFFSHLHSFFF